MTTSDPSALPSISATDARTDVEQGAVLLDVREQGEWDAGHAPAARLLPLSEMNVRLDELPREGRVVVVCRSGNRSRTVVAYLVEHGVDAVNLDGGMHAWVAAGGSFVSDHGTPTVA